jgi:hypothetical protein
MSLFKVLNEVWFVWGFEGLCEFIFLVIKIMFILNSIVGS